jgi:peptidoglycan/LPS O-acetylase OafA/YrhL
VIQGRELSDRKFQLDSLDGLRGVAILIVFLSHTSNLGTYLLPFANFSGIGKSGVYLFFVLSSFLLTLPFIKKGIGAANKFFLMNYSLRRFFRIYPLYFMYLLLGLVTSMVFWKITGSEQPVGMPFTLSLKEFFQQLLLIQGKGVTWSILVEFHYYFVLPLLALTYSIVLKNKLLPSIILTIILIYISQLIWPQSEAIQNDPRLGPYLPIFLMGSLLAVIYHNWQENNLSEKKKIALIVEILGMLSALILIFMIPSVSSYILEKEIPFNYYNKEFIVFGLLWSIVLFASVAGLGTLKKLFSMPILRYMGFISFSVYLLHVIVIEEIERVGTEIPMQGWIMLGLTVLASHLTWRFVEKPTSKIKITN